jgi:hypothetical protein
MFLRQVHEEIRPYQGGPRVGVLLAAGSPCVATHNVHRDRYHELVTGSNGSIVLCVTAEVSGVGILVTTCWRCREREQRITYALANVYEDTENPDELIKQEHIDTANAFVAAVEDGNTARLAQLFNHLNHPDPVVREEIATELIVSAAQLGHFEIIRLLYDMGGNLEEPDLKRGGRPLMHAAYNGHTAAVKTLIEQGAELEAQDENGYTALMVSVLADRSSAAEALLQAGAQVRSCLQRWGRAKCMHASQESAGATAAVLTC